MKMDWNSDIRWGRWINISTLKYDYVNQDFEIKEGKFVILLDGVSQDFCLRLETPMGTHFYYNDYGSTIPYLIGAMNSRDTHLAIARDIDNCIAQDNRIQSGSLDLTTNVNQVHATVKINSYKVEVAYDNQRVAVIPAN